MHPQAIKDIDKFVSSFDLGKFSIPSLARQWISAMKGCHQNESKQLHKILIDGLESCGLLVDYCDAK